MCVSYTYIARLQITGVVLSEGDENQLYFIYWAYGISVVSIFVVLVHYNAWNLDLGVNEPLPEFRVQEIVIVCKNVKCWSGNE